MTARSALPLLTSALLLGCMMQHLTIVESRSGFGGRVRAVEGREVDIPCIFDSALASWRKEGNPEYLVRYGLLQAPSHLGWEYGENLVQTKAQFSHAGRYECSIANSTMVIELEVIPADHPDTRRWRLDGRCGPNFPLYGDLYMEPAECDPLGAYPCCSTGGYCGYSYEHCTRYLDTDYRGSPIRPQTTTTAPPPAPACKSPFGKLAGKCLFFSDKSMSWQDAQDYCRAKLGQIVTFWDLDQISSVSNAIAQFDGKRRVFPYWITVSMLQKSSQGTLLEGESQESLETIVEAERECTFLMDSTINRGNCTSRYLPLCERVL